MKRPVVISGVVFVESVPNHLIDKPAIDSFIEMRRLHSEQQKPQERGEADDDPRRPLAFSERVFPSVDVIAEERKIP